MNILEKYNQEQLERFYQDLNKTEQSKLQKEIENIDFEQINSLYINSKKDEIIELKEIEIKITNIKKEKSEKETTYYITINIYDLKDAQEKECTTVNNLNQLNVKLDKKIPVFIKGKK